MIKQQPVSGRIASAMIAAIIGLGSLAVTAATANAQGSVLIRDDGTVSDPLSDRFVDGSGYHVRGSMFGMFGTITTGQFAFEISDDNGFNWESFMAFCAQPQVPVSQNADAIEYTVVDLDNYVAPYASGATTITTEGARALELLWANAFTTAPTGPEAAAMQMVIWEIMRDMDQSVVDASTSFASRLDFTTGHVQFNNATSGDVAINAPVEAIISDLVAGLDGGFTEPAFQLSVFVSDETQDLISFLPEKNDPGTGGPGKEGSPVPEPATWGMMLLGFALAASRLRRRARA